MEFSENEAARFNQRSNFDDGDSHCYQALKFRLPLFNFYHKYTEPG